MTSLSASGGSTIYIAQNGLNVEYSYNSTSWTQITWPCTITNSNTAAGNVIVLFTTDITLSTTNDFFSCNSGYIQFGSTSLNTDGSRPTITIATDYYDGLIQNGNNSTTGNRNIYIYNLFVDGTGYGTQIGAGWLCKKYFGKGTINNYVINCSSSGDINGGGILGDYAGTGSGAQLYVIGCSSDGSINNTAAGGIVGAYIGSDSGTVEITSCWSTGVISQSDAGGIVGSYAAFSSGSVSISSCYSTGIITGRDAGGIVGSFQAVNGTISIEKCYSNGSIAGTNAGGICGSNIISGTASQTCSISNCYTTGDINGSLNAGGIIGRQANTTTGPVILSITYCYTTGSTGTNKGYIIGGSTSIPAQNYSEAYNSSSGWSTSHAASVLTNGPASSPGVGSAWVSTAIAQPYELKDMGYTPYSVVNISSTNMVRTGATTISAGNSTTTAGVISGLSYTILQTTGGDSGSYSTIAINTTTGIISTTKYTVPGIYTLYIRNTGSSYNITTITLTVTAYIAPGLSWFTMKSVFSNNSQVYYKQHSLATGGVGSVRNYRSKEYKT